MQEDLAELQILLMDQQRSIESLSEQLIAHTKRFDAMERKLLVLESKLNTFSEGKSGEVSDERPPHY